MIPVLLSAVSLGAALLSASDRRAGASSSTRLPSPEDEVRRWPVVRLYRPSPTQLLLGVPDITFYVAVGEDPPSRTGAAMDTGELPQHVKDAWREAGGDTNSKGDPVDSYYEEGNEPDSLWWFATTDEEPQKDVLRAVEAVGIALSRDDYGALEFVDENNEFLCGRSPGAPVDSHLLTEAGTGAGLEALKHGYNLVAVPDNLDERYYRWYLCHPIPDTGWHQPDPAEKAERDELARREMARSMLFVNGKRVR